MIDTAAISVSLDAVEAALREELARSDARSETLVPVMRHLLANGSYSIFSDEVVSSARGLVSDIARQLLERLSGAATPEAGELAALSDILLENPALVGHIHALSMEWQFTQRLQTRLAVDPVLSPLLQELIASQDEAKSALAMRLLAAQARFCQSLRRMQMSLLELPGDLLHIALLGMRTLAGTEAQADERAAAAEAAVRKEYDEASTRLGLACALVACLGGGALAALSMTHAGAAIFLCALAMGSGQDRDAAVLSTDEAHFARFALGLRAAGLKPEGVGEQLLSLHPEIVLPEGFDRINADRAAALLSSAGYQGR